MAAVFAYTTDLILTQSANIPTGDAATAGGAITYTEIDNSSVGEWMPPLHAQETGTIDVDTELQYQLAYLVLTADDFLVSPTVTFVNSIRTMASDTIDAVSSSASDDSDIFLRVWGNASGMDYEDIPLNGTSSVSGSTTFSEIFRIEVRDSTDSDAQIAAVGTITITENSGGTEVARIPAGLRTASREYALAAPAATGNLATFTNRKTEPSGSPSWSIPCEAEGTSVTLPGPLDTVGGGDDWVGIYCRQTAQPGIGTATIDLQIAISGEVTYGTV